MTRVILRDGHVVELRKAENTTRDKGLIRDLLERSSEETLYNRFFEVVKTFDDDVIEHLIGDDGSNGLTLLCTDGTRVLAFGSYHRIDDGDSALVTFLVGDDVQRRGLGSLLLEHLAERAFLNGIKAFHARVLKDNERMMHVFQASGFAMSSNQESGFIHYVWPLRKTERSRALQETRERLATAASLHHFFHPKTVAVVGASRAPERLGHLIFRHILNSDYRGTVYPVNPTAGSVAAVKAYPSLKAVPEKVDLAVIVVPASQILTVADDVIDAQVTSVMIVSSGFSDTDPPGSALEREVVEKLRGAGCRVIGPSSLGLIQMDEAVRLNASFAPNLPEHGRVAIASHSGALGITILDYAARIGVGVSSFVSLGNRADVSGNDLLQYWESDPSTDMILLYLESFGNPRKFTRITRRITRNKPILAVKSARTPLSANVAKTRGVHATEDATVEAMFRQTGIIRVDTLQELFDVVVLLRAGQIRAGRRVAIVTNTAGGAVMTVDRLSREGLEFVHPVINLGFETLAESYRVVLPQVLRDESVDAVIVLFTPVGQSEEEAVRVAISAALCEVANDPVQQGVRHPYEKPVVANFLTTGDYSVRFLEVDMDREIPIYPFPEQAVRALAKVTGYHEYRDRDPGFIPDLTDIDTELARARIRQAMDGFEQPVALLWNDVLPILEVLGVPVAIAGSSVDTVRKFQVIIHTDPLFGPQLRMKEAGAAAVTVPSVVRLLPLTDADARSIWQDLMEEGIVASSESFREQVLDTLLRLSQWVEDVPEVLHATMTFGQSGDDLICLDGTLEAHLATT